MLQALISKEPAVKRCHLQMRAIINAARWLASSCSIRKLACYGRAHQSRQRVRCSLKAWLSSSITYSLCRVQRLLRRGLLTFREHGSFVDVTDITSQKSNLRLVTYLWLVLSWETSGFFHIITTKFSRQWTAAPISLLPTTAASTTLALSWKMVSFCTNGAENRSNRYGPVKRIRKGGSHTRSGCQTCKFVMTSRLLLTSHIRRDANQVLKPRQNPTFEVWPNITKLCQMYFYWSNLRWICRPV